MIDPDLKRDQDALLVGPEAKFVAADFDDRQVAIRVRIKVRGRAKV